MRTVCDRPRSPTDLRPDFVDDSESTEEAREPHVHEYDYTSDSDFDFEEDGVPAAPFVFSAALRSPPAALPNARRPSRTLRSPPERSPSEAASPSGPSYISK